jgi:hypothetical protein
MAAVDATNHGKGRPHLVIYGELGRAITGDRDVILEFWDGSRDHWTPPNGEITSMDRAVAEIVATLDGEAPFPYDARQAVQTLEAIIAFHISHQHNAAWVELPLVGSARDFELRTA